jgi:uncharacterized membrane protein
MPEQPNNFHELKKKLDDLQAKQYVLSDEINELKRELLNQMSAPDVIASQEPIASEPIQHNIISSGSEVINLFEEVKKSDNKSTASFPSYNSPTVFSEKKNNNPGWYDDLSSNFEKFIGENLLNKIGILITIIGVAIGTKYAIDHQLISPLTRIILAYLIGLGLMGVAFKLRSKYEKFSAVLLSGAMAINYFVTFAAYSLYALLPQPVAFVLMILFTIFTVIASLSYNNVVIAHIGLVGAYAVPFLLSTGSGKVEVLLAYIGLINCGILFISFKKFWRSLFYAAYVFTWAIIWFWVLDSFTKDYFVVGFTFNLIYFLQFYAIFIAFKVVKNHLFEKKDVIVLLSNAFVSYGLGYYLMSYLNYDDYLGLFTVAYALVHFAVCVLLFKKAEVDKSVFYLVAGLVLAFVTISISVQFSGHYVTLLWMIESIVVFVIARKNKIAFYEQLSVPLFLLALISYFEDTRSMQYFTYAGSNEIFVPFANMNFLSGVLMSSAFCFLTWFSRRKEYASMVNPNSIYSVLVKYGLPIISIVLTYGVVKFEVDTWLQNLYQSTAVVVNGKTGTIPDYYYNEKWNHYRMLFDIAYSMVYALLLYFVNRSKVKNKELNVVFLLISGVSTLLFFTGGLYQLSVLREIYLHPSSSYSVIEGFNLWLRYPLIILALFTLKFFLNAIEFSFVQWKNKIQPELVYSVAAIWLFSSEWLNWSDIFDIAWSYKLGLSILWGVCSLALIVRGIFKRIKLLRLLAIGLFGITLVKLFFYDIASLSTILKTVVFIALGVLLLIISFLYNKYGLTIFKDDESSEN